MMNYFDNPQNPSLYKWNKHDAKLNARMKDASSIQTIHQWLRKVETASETAINSACSETAALYAKLGKTNPAQVKNSNNQNDPYSEAHDLLNHWVTDKIRMDLDEDIYNYVNVDEINEFSSNKLRPKEEKFSLVDYLDQTDANKNITTGLLHISGLDYDKYDETYIAKDIVGELMKKRLVNTKELLKKDQKSNKFDDLKAKIDMRHQKVKENREKRTKDVETKRKENLIKKEAELNAREMIKKEENEKRMRKELEQQLLEQETERLRKEIAIKRQHDELVKQKQREYELAQQEKVKNEETIQQKLMVQYVSEYAVDLKRKEMEEKRAEDMLESYLKAKNMRVMQKAFSVWYGLVLEFRLKTGKAKALHDWRTTQKLFNAWKKLSLSKKMQKEQEIHKNLIQIQNMKYVQATNYYHYRLTLRQNQTKQFEEEKKKTKSKMQIFLEAASTGKLTTDNGPIELKENDANDRTPSGIKTERFTNHSATSTNRSRTENRELKIMSTIDSTPIADDLMLVIPDTEREARINKQVRQVLRPWLKIPPPMSTDTNRLKAHEKLLHEQNKMIKEQKQIIEDLKYQQNQQIFKEQIALLEQIKQKQEELERMQKVQFEKEKFLIKEEAKLVTNTKRAQLNKDKSSARTENEPAVDLESPSTSKLSAQQNIFVKNMEERAQKRDQLRKEREDRKFKEDLEKLKENEEKEVKKRLIEEEKRRKQNEELKEKRRQERELKLKRDMERECEKINEQKADLFYRKYLLRHYCLNGLKKIILLRHMKMDLAVQAYQTRMLKTCINIWSSATKTITNKKKHRADQFYGNYLLRHYFVDGMKMLKTCVHLEISKANRFYMFHLKMKLFKNWVVYKNNEIIKFDEYDTWLGSYATNKLKSKYLRIWKIYPDCMKALREREKRLNSLRNKVQQFLPDFHKLSIDSSKNGDV